MTRFQRISHCVGVGTLLLSTILANWSHTAIAAQLSLTWTSGSPDETAGFSIERSDGATGPFVEIDTADPASTTYVDPMVADGPVYCYRVRAFSTTAFSDYSNMACGTTAQVVSLAVVKIGAGAGAAISTPAGIICGSSCSGAFAAGTAVTLMATPAVGSVFTGWSGGGCSGTGSCAVMPTSSMTVSATFDLSQSVGLAVAIAGTGTGTVGSAPSGIQCAPTCAASYPQGTIVTLTATAPTSSTFAGWSGACSGTGPCAVTLTSARTVTATFNQQSQSPALTVNTAGKGSVASNVPGIDCGKTCSAIYPGGTAVTLTAAPGSGFSFAGWSGDCSGTDMCTVTMTGARAVTATFRNLKGK